MIHRHSARPSLPSDSDRSATRRLISPWAATVAGLLLLPAAARALPSFARQMDLQCTACHTEFPVLNQLGRSFKLSGYTGAAENSDAIPLAVMLQPSFTHTAKAQDGGAAPGFGPNDNWALSQASIFYAGRLLGPLADKLLGKDNLLDHVGLFSQTTYDGIAKAWTWDNTELRVAGTAPMGDNDVKFGVYANNNPTMQDLWNTTPAWGFPFSGSKLAPGPAAATMIEGGLAQQVAGVGGYALFADTFYVDLGGYHTLGAHLQKSLGVDPTGEAQIPGLAPYWRLAMEKMIGEGRWEFGTFGMAADAYPGRDPSEGKDRLVDVGFDTQYQLSSGPHDTLLMASWIHESETWDASSALGNTANASDSLWSFKATADYLYDKTYGAAVQYFRIDGSSDAGLYSGSANGSPTSDGFVFQLNYLPFNKQGGPSFWTRSNVKLSLQYTVYNRVDGARTNFDGAGTNAKDDNTLYLEAWVAF